ncbi:MAG: radical SAM protein [Nitrososphaeria archaeon]|jgi:radical SAM protein with 4Fe4S-binding SPASM domain
MIPVSVMVTGRGTVSRRLKGDYGPGRPSRFSEVWRPVVSWNLTYACNLRCVHCYIRAGARGEGELGREEARGVLRQMAEVGVPLVLFSGGEPLMRPDALDLMEEAADMGMRVALSTNGTLITEEVASRLSRIGVSYVGISLDSPRPAWHDLFRGVEGAFAAAMRGLRNAVGRGLDVGLRMTVTARNAADAAGLLDLAESAGARRVTFYHLSAAGRALELGRDWYMGAAQYSSFVDLLVEEARRRAGAIEIETTMAPFDGIAVADRVSRSGAEFRDMMELVRSQGGCGRKIVSIYPDGTLRPCQFVDFMELGSLRRSRLRDLLDPSRREVDYFANTERYLSGPRCSTCPFRSVCKGGDRVRAYYMGGGLGADDPQCPLDARGIAERWGWREGSAGES